MERLFLSGHTNVQDVRNKISSQFVNNPIPIFKIIKRLNSISYRFWSDFDKIELNWNCGLKWPIICRRPASFKNNSLKIFWQNLLSRNDQTSIIILTSSPLTDIAYVHEDIKLKPSISSNSQYHPILNIFQFSTPPFFLRGFPPEEQKLRKDCGKIQQLL